MLGDFSVKQRLLLAEFVKNGGGLVLLGGFSGYGKSRVHVSPLLMDLLPVTTRGLWDLRKAPGDGLLAGADERRFAHLDWKASPRVFYYHDVMVKDGASVWLHGSAIADGKETTVPLLVSRPYGKGMVLAFLGTEIGDPGTGQTAIWAWSDWGRLLTIMVNAARGQVDERGDERPQWTPAPVTVVPHPPTRVPQPPAEEKYTGTHCVVAHVRSEKICYRPGEWAGGTVTLFNGTAQAVSGKLNVAIRSGFADTRPLLQQRRDPQSRRCAARAGDLADRRRGRIRPGVVRGAGGCRRAATRCEGRLFYRRVE